MLFEERWRKWEVEKPLKELRHLRQQLYLLEDQVSKNVAGFNLPDNDKKRLVNRLEPVINQIWSLETHLDTYVTMGRTRGTQKGIEDVYRSLIRDIGRVRDTFSSRSNSMVYSSLNQLHGIAYGLEDKTYKTISQNIIGRAKADG